MLGAFCSLILVLEGPKGRSFGEVIFQHCFPLEILVYFLTVYKETVVPMYPAVAGGGVSCSVFLKFRSRIWVCRERGEKTHTHTYPPHLFSPSVFFHEQQTTLPSMFPTSQINSSSGGRQLISLVDSVELIRRKGRSLLHSCSSSSFGVLFLI